MEDDWDLHAVVRGCAALASSAAAANSTRSSQAPYTHQLDCSLSATRVQDLFEFEPRRNSFFQEELHDLCRPFFPKSQIPFPLPISPLSAHVRSLDPPSPPPQLVKQLTQQTSEAINLGDFADDEEGVLEGLLEV